MPKIGFKSNPVRHITPSAIPLDGYVSNPLYEKFGTKSEIEEVARTNPRIKEILNEYNMHAKVNEKELERLKNGHLQKTRITAAKMYSNLPAELKQTINHKELQEAAMFHDYGKVLIPDSILNKKGELNESEWEIMQQHSELGAELLKDKNMSPRTLELIKYHHQNGSGSGYPMSDRYKYGLDSEILSVADRYEALVEERSYKGAMTKDDALSVLQDDVKSGLVSQEVFDALKKSV